MTRAPVFFSWRSLVTLTFLMLFLGLAAQTVTLLAMQLSDPFWSRRLPWLNEVRIQTGLLIGKRWGDLTIFLMQLTLPVIALTISAQVVTGLAEGLVVRVGSYWSYFPFDTAEVRLRLDRQSKAMLLAEWRAAGLASRRRLYRTLLNDVAEFAAAACAAGKGDTVLVLSTPHRFASRLGLAAEPPGLWQRLGLAGPSYAAPLARVRIRG